MKIDNVEELNISSDKRYNINQAYKLISMIKESSVNPLRYAIRQGHIKGELKKHRGLGQSCWMIKGKDLEEYIVRKYF